MKNHWITILLLVLTQHLYTQQDVKLPGVVVEQNSQFRTGAIKYLSNAQIKAREAAPVFSDIKGQFTLLFADKPTGGVARIFATKKGFEVVNKKELESAAVMGRIDPLKVVLCPAGQLAENQYTYYNIAKDAVVASYERKLGTLNKKSREQQILIAQLQVDFKQKINTIEEAKKLLEKQKQAAEKQAEDLAEKFVTVNLDDQTESYQRAFRAFLDKDIDLAITILDSVDIERRLALNTSEKQREEDLVDTLQSSIAQREKQIQQDINQCIFKANLHILEYQFDKAETLFELAVQYAPTNTDILFEFAYFLQKQNRFQKALIYYPKVLQLLDSLAQKNPDIFQPDMASTLNNLGILLSDNNEMDQAKKHYQEALQIRRQLAQKNPDVFQPDVAMTLNNLGNLLSDNNEMDKAQKHYQEALQLYRKLAQKNPDVFQPYVATTLNNLGGLLRANNEMDKAQKHYQEALQLYRQLAQKNLDVFQPDVAMTLNNLGVLLRANNEMDKAKKHYQEALQLYRTLAQKNPDVYLPYVTSTLNNLGNLLSDNNEMDKAQKHYQEALQIYRKLAQKNPDVFQPYVAGTLNNLGVLLRANNEMDKAQKHYQEALQLYRKLAQKNPDVFQPDVAMTLNNLGILLSDNNEMDKAQKHYQEALQIYRKLVQKNPDVYLPDVATTLNNLGALLSDNNEMDKAQKHYQEALQIYGKLAQKNPKVYNLDVCMTAINLGLFYEEILESMGDMSLKEEGIQLMEDTRLRLSIFPKDHPVVKQYTPYVDRLLEFFSSFTMEQFELNQKIDAIETLKQQNETEQDVHQKVVRQQQIVDLHHQLELYLPDNKDLQNLIASEYGSLAWYQLFDQQFTAAEEAARKGLSIDPTEEWISTNLALSLLYQGKWEAAKAIYLPFKDQPQGDGTYKEVFLEDLDALEKAGITHPDVEKIRQLLQK